MPASCCSERFERRISLRRPISGSSGPFELARAPRELLRVEVLLAAGVERRRFATFVAGVDAVARRERRGEHEPRLERGLAAYLQVGAEDVRGVDEEVRPRVLRHRSAELLQVLGQLEAAVLPGEVGVGLVEADLRERAHLRRGGERLGEKDHLRVRSGGTVPISHSQNANGLVCGLSTRKTLTAWLTQKSTIPSSACQSSSRLLGVEVEVDDVLVALRRVLRVGDRAVRAVTEPGGCSEIHGWSG